MNFGNILKISARYFPDNIAIIEGNIEINYYQFEQDSNKVASALVGMGVEPGDCVCVCLPNSAAWLVTYYGILKAGAITLTPSFLFTEHELYPILDEAKPKVLFTVPTKLDQLQDLNKRDYLRLIVCENGDLSYPSLLARGSISFIPVDRDRRDVASILYTGGTTGVPKGIRTTHENLYTTAYNIVFCEKSTPIDRQVCFLPMDHIMAQIHVIGSTICTAGGLIVHSSFDLDKFLYAIASQRVTKIIAVPTVYFRLLGVQNLRERLRSVRYCFSAGAAMAPEVIGRWKMETGLEMYGAYGMTETTATCTYNHYYRPLIGSVGTPVNLVEVQIRDLEGNIMGPETEGEICIRGPNVMKGYLTRPELSQNAFWGEWFRSGDIGIFDRDGYLYIVDRIKDMVITGGENVYPREIENVLYTRGEVKECAVVGMPDKEYGERVVAFIIPQEGSTIDPRVFKTYMKSRLTGYKVPKDFVTVSELPRSSTGKILKREIVKTYGDRRK